MVVDWPRNHKNSDSRMAERAGLGWALAVLEIKCEILGTILNNRSRNAGSRIYFQWVLGDIRNTCHTKMIKGIST